jgi:hypothetical protein
LFQILQIIQLKVISYLDTYHLLSLEKGKGVDGWHDMQSVAKLLDKLFEKRYTLLNGGVASLSS